MDISVAICTYNRCESLRRTLATLADLRIPSGVAWEVLVVDNNSTDATRPLCDAGRGSLPIRYILEPRQGLNCARNRAVAEARGQLLIFTDDDVNLDKDWLASLWEAAACHPEINIFGGKIYPVWEMTPPPWVTENARSHLRFLLLHHDLGDKERIITDLCATPFGPNMAFRKEVFTDQFRFREDLDRNGHGQVRGGETDLILRLVKAGHQRLYTPKAVVQHRNLPGSATERYVFAYYIGAGITEARVGHQLAPGRDLFGAPRGYWSKLIRHGSKYLMTRWTRPSSIWLPALINAGRSWGLITESRRRRSLANRAQPVVDAVEPVTDLAVPVDTR